MSLSTNNNVSGANTCPICNLTFESRKEFIKHNLSDEQFKRTRAEYEEELEIARVFEDKNNGKDIAIDNTITKYKAIDFVNINTKDEDDTNTKTESKTIAKDEVMDNTITEGTL